MDTNLFSLSVQIAQNIWDTIKKTSSGVRSPWYLASREKLCFAYAMKMQIQRGDFHGPSARTSPGLNKYLYVLCTYIRACSRFEFQAGHAN